MFPCTILRLIHLSRIIDSFYAFAFMVIDVTYRDLQRRTIQWLQGKTVEGTAPMGPWLVTNDEIADPVYLKDGDVVRLEIDRNGALENKVKKQLGGIDMNKVLSYIDRIDKNIDEIIGISICLPEELVHWKPADDVWSIQQTLCHVREAIPYWIDEIESIVNKRSTEWGRTMQDEKRLAAVTLSNQVSTTEVLDSIKQIKAGIRDTLLKLKDEDFDMEAQSINPKFGMKPMAFLMDHFVVEHIANHARQIQRNINQYS